TARVATPPGCLIPTSSDGTVTFYDGTTVLGTATLSGSPATATLTTTTLAAGQHTITASYSGDNNFVASQSGVEPTSTQVVVLAGSLAGLRSSAVDSEGDIFVVDTAHSQVLELKLDGSQTTVGSGLLSPTGVAVDAKGDVFIDDLGLDQEVGALAGLPVPVSPALPSISVSTSSATPVYGQPVTLTATVTTPSGEAIPTSSDGTVTFYDGGTMIGTAQALSGSPATATLTAA